MLSIRHLLSEKLYTIPSSASVRLAAAIMEQHHIGCLPVVDEGKLVGIITSRDIRRSHPNRLVADAMTKKVITIRPSASLWEAYNLLLQHQIERLVVADGGTVLGVITKAQVVAEFGKYIDPLTTLYRAEIFYQRAVELLEGGYEIAIIFLDIDNFGLINKEYGHVYGDIILRRTAEILKTVVDIKQDTLCRYAGDEFAIVTTRSLAKAKELAETIISAVAQEKWPCPVTITLSAGISGGRRSSLRNLTENPGYIIKHLVNMASLASAKAKKLNTPIFVADTIELRASPFNCCERILG
ncbi:MAG: GGDEF domain-containing protein [Thermanaeromonas sp.]|uniref:GGDEF domain-containing protein n=1 Tax=Thermanaeromonas sp. TaxID=2003697 RepID=UPI0024388084|nr:GGDEF domain-containing protein [Thermanaeromonas sp.]MCG0277329.1 GGDEF domain-containing protein [Thermanaeromonas sp.]